MVITRSGLNVYILNCLDVTSSMYEIQVVEISASDIYHLEEATNDVVIDVDASKEIGIWAKKS